MNSTWKNLLGGLAATLAMTLPHAVQAQEATACGAEVKAEITKIIDGAAAVSEAELLKVEAQIYDKYKACGTIDSAQIPSTDPIHVAARQCGAKVSILGSLFYEEMSCCGYDPQRRTFACPVKVKQRFGFGASPLPGSREYVLHCVADAAGVLQAVGRDSVHLSNSTFAPPWQFAIVANADAKLNLVQPMNGAVRRARSILSWNLQPTSCSYVPIWGNALDYAVRLDQ